jgi:hypothetical protein
VVVTCDVSLCSGELIASAGCYETSIRLYHTAQHRIKDGHCLEKYIGIFVFKMIEIFF